MVLLNEFLPNPAGSDARGEWIELWNNGSSAANLNGWKIVSGSGKFSLSGKNIPGGGYLLLPRSETKLALKNTDGRVVLYDGSGKPVDSASFLGAAPEGKSFARMAIAGGGNFSWSWSEPTPGTANAIPTSAGIIRNVYPVNTPLNKPLNGIGFIGLMFGVAATLTGLVMFVLKSAAKEKSKNGILDLG